MAARYCVDCGNLVTTSFCPSCGALQPVDTPDRSTADSADTTWINPEDATAALLAPDLSPSPGWSAPSYAPPVPPSQAPETRAYPSAVAHGASFGEQSESAAAQPWHPFEQPAWYSASSPRRPPAGGAAPIAEPPDVLQVGTWQTEPPTPGGTSRSRWVIGSIAAAAVVAIAVAVVVVISKATPGSATAPDTSANSTGVGTSEVATVDPATAAAPPLSATGGTEPPATTLPASEVTTVADSTDASVTSPAQVTVPIDPMGGPVQEIACAPGYIVQVASGKDEATFQARVAELAALGELPADLHIAHTDQSCPIFTQQTNSIVLYAGPFASPYDGCEARVAAPADAFIRGTTEATASDYVSCLCPTSAVMLPAITTIGQTGVWIGELQRVLVRKLNYKIPNLSDKVWGVYSQTTSNAVTTFQQDSGLPATGFVDGATWQALQTAQC